MVLTNAKCADAGKETAAKQESYKKAYLLTKNIGRIFGKKFRRMDQQAEKR